MHCAHSSTIFQHLISEDQVSILCSLWHLMKEVANTVLTCLSQISTQCEIEKLAEIGCDTPCNCLFLLLYHCVRDVHGLVLPYTIKVCHTNLFSSTHVLSKPKNRAPYPLGLYRNATQIGSQLPSSVKVTIDWCHSQLSGFFLNICHLDDRNEGRNKSKLQVLS